MTRIEAGRKGGRATVEKYGRDHMARIGSLGFAALARRYGFQGGHRRTALRKLIEAGKIVGYARNYTKAEADELYRAVGLDGAPEAP